MIDAVALPDIRRLWAAGWRPEPGPYLYWGRWTSGDWTLEVGALWRAPEEGYHPTCSHAQALTWLETAKGWDWGHRWEFGAEDGNDWYADSVTGSVYADTPEALIAAILDRLEATP